MSTDALDNFRGANYEIAEKIAPTWERRRSDIEEVATPVREWMLRELGPQEGDTVLELAAGVGDTGFEAAGIIGGRGHLITTDFSPAMLEAARRRREGVGKDRGRNEKLGERRLRSLLEGLERDGGTEWIRKKPTFRPRRPEVLIGRQAGFRWHLPGTER